MSVDPENSPEPRIRIGELSRRAGVGVDTLRAWERRYEVFRPSRSPGGFRLYGPGDEARARRMSELIAEGHSTAEAARAVVRPAGPPAAGAPAAEEVGPLVEALVALDEGTANSVLDRVLATLSLEQASALVILPAMREVGSRWSRGEIGIAEEHFASNLVRARLLALTRGWGSGGGRRALLACPPGEKHDLALIVFGLALRDRGWRVTFLGADTPTGTIEEAAGRLRPEAVVVAALSLERIEAEAEALASLARSQRLLLAGPTEVTAAARRLGAEPLPPDAVEGAAALDAG
ncbi:MAG: cobalamin B12-binding domain-containing protein [Actinobacteria bacterium]|nr:cobalamin B12-binding domain-containing protein [Actinomycetota bacterium]